MTETAPTSAESDDEPTATEGAVAIESVADVEALRDRDDVPFTTETDVLDRETFERLREDADVGDGAAIVGITNDDSAVLLKNTCTGWLPPGGNVGPGDGWSAVARQQAESWTGLAVELDGVECVRRIDRRPEGSDSAEADDSDASETDDPETDDSEADELPFHVVYFRASLTATESPAGDSVAGDLSDSLTSASSASASSASDESDDEAPEIEWFDAVPEGVDSDHDDDVAVFFD
jgi:hypothetical protein